MMKLNKYKKTANIILKTSDKQVIELHNQVHNTKNAGIPSEDLIFIIQGRNDERRCLLCV